MRLSHPLAIKSCALAISGLLRLWMCTLDVRFVMADPKVNPLAPGRRSIFLFWHEGLLLPTHTHVAHGFSSLVSKHRDGELIAQVIRMLRGHTSRGSTTRGGAAGLRQMIRQGQSLHLAITPDGPRGPRRVVQDGAVYLASRTGMALVPTGCAFAQCWRMPSWDSFALPKPGSRAAMVFGAPIEIPEDLDAGGIEEYRLKVQAAMHAAQGLADRTAAVERFPAGGLTLRQARQACRAGIEA